MTSKWYDLSYILWSPSTKTNKKWIWLLDAMSVCVC